VTASTSHTVTVTVTVTVIVIVIIVVVGIDVVREIVCAHAQLVDDGRRRVKL
jgi:hypothetical protein